MFCQQCLVGCDHVLAAFQQAEHDGAGRLQAADELNHYRDGRVIDERFEVGAEEAFWKLKRTGLFNVSDDDCCQFKRSTSLAGNSVTMRKQNLGHTAPHRPQADNSYFGCFHGVT